MSQTITHAQILHESIKTNNLPLFKWIISKDASLMPHCEDVCMIFEDNWSDEQIMHLISCYHSVFEKAYSIIVEWSEDPIPSFFETDLKSHGKELFDKMSSYFFDIMEEMSEKAAEYGRLPIIEILESQGFFDYQTIFQIACFNANKHIIEWALAKGAIVNQESVINAAVSGSLELIEYLVSINNNLDLSKIWMKAEDGEHFITAAILKKKYAN